MNFQRLIASAASLLTAGLAACADPPPLYGDSPTVPGNNMPVPMAMPDLAMDPYPSGPYGVQEGDTLDDIDLPGYRLSVDNNDPTVVPWEDSITLASVRSQSKAKCIWLAFDAFWWGACRQEQRSLPAEIASQDPESPDIQVYHILMEGPQNGSHKVTKDDLDNWANEFKQTYPTVMDTPTTNAFNRIAAGWAQGGGIGLPFNLIVDRKTMVVKGHLTSPNLAGAKAMCDQ